MAFDYGQQLDQIAGLRWRVKRALQRACFNVREGTADQKLLYDAVFSNRTHFGLEEVCLLAWHFSWGDNDLSVLGNAATDAQVQICVDAILPELITRQKARTVVIGLDL